LPVGQFEKPLRFAVTVVFQPGGAKDRVLESDRDRRAVGGFARIRPSKLANAVNARLFVDVSLKSVPIEVIDGQALSILGLRPPPAIEQVP
jgi:hypothetical protein